MKTFKRCLLIFVLSVLFYGCGASPQEIALETASAETAAAASWTATPEPSNTPEPSPTPTLEPTATLKPSPTPVVLPGVLDQTFIGVNVIYRDDFNFVMRGIMPDGWELMLDNTRSSSLAETEDSNFRIFASEGGAWDGLVFYYPAEDINPGEGVYFTFKYAGTSESFTLGMDTIEESGLVYHSVAMQLENTTLSAHIIEDKFQGDGYFEGDLRLQEETWYGMLLAYDEEENYIIKIWEPGAPENQLVYYRNWPDFPKEYYFISWMSAKRTLWLDEFTIFSFDDIVLE
jgi:hypothetical protein